jgi:phage shock protein PspC (stress-responsive transcriptional regulator)
MEFTGLVDPLVPPRYHYKCPDCLAEKTLSHKEHIGFVGVPVGDAPEVAEGQSSDPSPALQAQAGQSGLRRCGQDGVIGGVCLGMSRYFGVDLAIVRILWAIFIIFGPGIWVYLVCWACMPDSES